MVISFLEFGQLAFKLLCFGHPSLELLTGTFLCHHFFFVFLAEVDSINLVIDKMFVWNARVSDRSTIQVWSILFFLMAPCF